MVQNVLWAVTICEQFTILRAVCTEKFGKFPNFLLFFSNFLVQTALKMMNCSQNEQLTRHFVPFENVTIIIIMDGWFPNWLWTKMSRKSETVLKWCILVLAETETVQLTKSLKRCSRFVPFRSFLIAMQGIRNVSFRDFGNSETMLNVYSWNLKRCSLFEHRFRLPVKNALLNFLRVGLADICLPLQQFESVT